MSRQFNYFAMGGDEKYVCEALLNVFGELCVFASRGALELMQPHRVVAPDELLSLKVTDFAVLTSPELAISVPLEEISDNYYYLSLRSAPVLE